ncbi:MAG: nuclear transport factor 2 family protein [Chthoniobacterales bacterium]
MKLVTATLVALSGLSLCVAPLVSAQTADNSAIETKLKGMEDAWAAAQLQPDHGASAVEAMLATDYAGVGGKGVIRTKASQIEHMRADTDTYSSAKNNKMDVHVYGPNLAVVVGTSTEAGKDKDGKAFDRSYAWIDTWMERDGQWQCIASGGTPVVTK